MRADYKSGFVTLIGRPNVGKSTLFNAITKKDILIANYPFATIDPNVGVVTVPDKRVEVLENMYDELEVWKYNRIQNPGVEFRKKKREISSLFSVISGIFPQRILVTTAQQNPSQILVVTMVCQHHDP